MLGKCTNPSCSASFRYLQDGVLFRLEVDPALRLPNPKQPEYYWLCHSCSSAMTLRLSREGKVIPVPLSARVDSSRDSRRQGGRPSGRQGPDFIPSKPQNGLLLTGVRFATERHHRSRSKGAAAGEEDTMSDDWDHADVVLRLLERRLLGRSTVRSPRNSRELAAPQPPRNLASP